MSRTLHRRTRSRLDVEALESRYVLDASAALAALHFGPSRIDPTHVAPQQIDSNDSVVVQSMQVSFAANSDLAPARVAPQIEIDVFRLELRNPFNAVHEQFIEVITFQSFTGISSRPIGSSSEEALSFASISPPHSTSIFNTPGLEQSSAQASEARSEEASAALASSQSDAAVAVASRTARRLDSIVVAAVPTDRRSDRPVPTAFATALAADAVRPADAHVPEASRPLSTPGDLTMPRIPVRPSDPEGPIDSTSQNPPVQQAQDAVFSGLFVDGFAPQMLDHAFRALKSVEAHLETPDGSRWYRLALGCWVVAAALAYEAGRQT
ncbi:MAG TPA: hypothetical protein VHR72_02100, partial [Gemmataceae bacterium]|nr:hypothetical protein [Gemmataceae bacterium]